jgi:hypothetical protein
MHLWIDSRVSRSFCLRVFWYQPRSWLLNSIQQLVVFERRTSSERFSSKLINRYGWPIAFWLNLRRAHSNLIPAANSRICLTSSQLHVKHEIVYGPFDVCWFKHYSPGNRSLPFRLNTLNPLHVYNSQYHGWMSSQTLNFWQTDSNPIRKSNI